MQVYAWVEFPLLIPGIWLLKYCILPPIKNRDTKSVRGRNLQRNKPSSKHTNTQIKIPFHHGDLELTNVEHVSSNEKSSQFGAML